MEYLSLLHYWDFVRLFVMLSRLDYSTNYREREGYNFYPEDILEGSFFREENDLCIPLVHGRTRDYFCLTEAYGLKSSQSVATTQCVDPGQRAYIGNPP